MRLEREVDRVSPVALRPRTKLVVDAATRGGARCRGRRASTSGHCSPPSLMSVLARPCSSRSLTVPFSPASTIVSRPLLVLLGVQDVGVAALLEQGRDQPETETVPTSTGWLIALRSAMSPTAASYLAFLSGYYRGRLVHPIILRGSGWRRRPSRRCIELVGSRGGRTGHARELVVLAGRSSGS